MQRIFCIFVFLVFSLTLRAQSTPDTCLTQQQLIRIATEIQNLNLTLEYYRASDVYKSDRILVLEEQLAGEIVWAEEDRQRAQQNITNLQNHLSKEKFKRKATHAAYIMGIVVVVTAILIVK